MSIDDLDVKSSDLTDLLRVEGIKAKGFGIIPKIVMQDPRLSKTAKLIYAYFCSFAGAGTTAFPSVNKICRDLEIKEYKTFNKHLKILVKYGYIKVEQQRKAGKFHRNIYTLIDYPVETDIESAESEISAASDDNDNEFNDNELAELFFKIVGRRNDEFIHLLESKFEKDDIIKQINYLGDYIKSHKVNNPEGFIFEALKKNFKSNLPVNKKEFNICPKCNGMAFDYNPDKNTASPCDKCHGTGKIPVESVKA